jgi:hypothetical protein
LAVGAAVHVDVLHAHEPGSDRFGGGKDAGLQGGELRGPLRVWRVEGLVDDAGSLGGRSGEGGVAGVAADDLDVVGDRCVAGSVDEPDGLAAPAQGVVGGQTDGSGAEDDVPGGGHTIASAGVAAEGGPTAGR